MTGGAEGTVPAGLHDVVRRVRGLVESVVRPDELLGIDLAWGRSRLDDAGPGWRQPAPAVDDPVLLLTVRAVGGETFAYESWRDPVRASGDIDWEGWLHRLAGDLEDWVCETRFAWGEQRRAVVPD